MWEQRKYQNLDDDQVWVLVRCKLRCVVYVSLPVSAGAAELDVDGTIRETAKQGILDVQLVPERRNRIKVLMLFDVGGSMDAYIAECEVV